jgi:hypothetical protein
MWIPIAAILVLACLFSEEIRGRIQVIFDFFYKGWTGHSPD